MQTGQEDPFPPDDGGWPPPQSPYAPPPTAQGAPASIPLNGMKIPQAYIDIIWPGYKIEGDQLVYRGSGQAPAVDPAGVASYLKPFADAYGSNNYKDLFNTVMGSWKAGSEGSVLTDPAVQQRLKAFGYNISPANASHQTSKIQLPNGSWVRVITGDPNSNAWSYDWVEQPAGGGAAGNLGGGDLGPLLQPFGEPPPDWHNSDFEGTPFDFPNFVGPTDVTEKNDPGYKARYGLGMDSMTNNAAASGMLRSGNSLTDFIKFGQDYASSEFQNVYNRDYNTWNANLGKAFNTWQGANAQKGQNWQHAMDTWNQNFNIYKWNKTWPYTVLSDQQKIGLNAANS